MKKGFVALLIVVSNGVCAQSWFGGSVVMKDAAVHSGLVSLQLDQLVLFKSQQGVVTVLPAHKVDYFRYFDPKENMHHVFVSRVEAENAMRKTSFYESVIRGWINVYRKQRWEPDTATDEKNFAYYVEWNDQLVSLKRFRQQVYPSMMRNLMTDAQSEDLRKLNPNNKSEALKIIQWYNKHYTTTSIAGI